MAGIVSDFASKRYVVTGAASGIGHVVAEKLAAAGAEIFALDRNTPSAPITRYLEVDLATRRSIDAAVGQLDGQFDGLINVAGIPGTAPGDVVLAVNTLAARHLTESLLDRLTPGGSVTVVSSTSGFGWPARLDDIRALLATESFEAGQEWFKAYSLQGNAYTFSKEAATVYALSTGLAFAQRGLRINAVVPGPVETPILVDFEKSMGRATLDGLKQLLGRHAHPADVADAILFVASDAARWVNGHALVVDGGATGAVATGVIPAPEI